MDLYAHDDAVRRKGFRVLAGIDEAGRGPLAGPVVAAAVVLNPGFRVDGVRDSKKIGEKERQQLFWDIVAGSADIGIGISDSSEIDSINILNATKKAMHEAVSSLFVKPTMLLLDAVTLPAVDIDQTPIVKGDAKSASIAAASIIAKVVRDSIMQHYHSIYPAYNFHLNKGYATKAHIKCILDNGPCPIHRTTFQGVLDMKLPYNNF
ncbi:MAG: ribonuclease HII [Dissulfurispiraceae bacterium]|jgi:ribonuclease HII|nr:ribonuclease HII [Dissulfurispiraceae bacterium]